MPKRWRSAALLLATLATPGRADPWRGTAAVANDAFSDASVPLDDFGFTHDNVLAVAHEVDDTWFGGYARQRLITSTIDRRRWDQVDLLATAERSVDTGSLVRLDVAVRLGPTMGGNFGGRYIQNGWHSFSGTGPTIEEGLANAYPGDRRFGALAGIRARGELGDRLRAYGVLDGQGTLGAGVSSIEAALGGAAAAHHIGVHVELAVTRYHVADGNLALPGGYGAGWQLEWRLGIDVSWSGNRYRVAYELRANEGGSGEPIGVVAFSWSH
ncbi:MAG TPA: hypothetical protein VLB44_00025 [Kofleriaceae bacterium]|nr:hypothetical protein [Kofleriaceae bacterium]